MDVKRTSRIPRALSGLYAVLTLVSLGWMLWVLRLLPGAIPVHWNLGGRPKAFVPKTAFVVGWAGFVVFLYVVVRFFLHRSAAAFRWELPIRTEEDEDALTMYLQLRSMLVGFNLLCVLGVLVFFAVFSIWYSLFPQPGFFVPLTLCVVLVTLVLLFLSSKMLRKRRAELLKFVAPSLRTAHPEEEDRYWRWGIFYKNPSDSRFLVGKRSGWGWTFNVAHPGMVALFLFVVFGILLFFVL